MKSTQLLKIILLTLNVIVCVTNSQHVNFKYDYSDKDIVIYNGKLYYSSSYLSTINLQPNKLLLSSISRQLNENTPVSETSKEVIRHEEEFATGGSLWLYILSIFCKKSFLIILVLTCFAGAMSGLTVGYLSIDDLVLELKTTTGTDQEKEHAAILIPLLSKKHWLLVTLLVSNAFAMESLPLCLGNI